MNWIITIVILTGALSWVLTYKYKEEIKDLEEENAYLKKLIKDKAEKDNRGRY